MSTQDSNLADVLFGRTRSSVLALLYGRPEQSFYTRQIAREAGASVGAIQRELGNLANAGLIVRSSLGNQVFYRANRDSPVFPEMRSLVNKTVGVFEILRGALEGISRRITVAFVYGSMARGEEKAGSDLDLMVVGAATIDDVLSHLSEVEKTIGRPINPSVYSVAEFRSKVAKGNHFLNAVLKDKKVFLLGDEHELGKVGRVRMAKKGSHQSR